MSFSAAVKSELCHIHPESPCCLSAQAYGMLLFSRGFSRREMHLQTENREVAERLKKLAEQVCGAAPVLSEPPAAGGLYNVSIAPEDREQVLSRFHHNPDSVSLRLSFPMVESDCCQGAFLRGAFLVCGSLVDPAKEYHMEFLIFHKKLSEDFLRLLREMDVKAKTAERNGVFVVYVKDSENIEDVLTLMGAQNATLSLMHTKIMKDFRNKANRITNCETANIQKTVDASLAQQEAVYKLINAGRLNELPEELQRIALLRRDNPEYSLKELCELAGVGISKSGMNHRLQRIIWYANNI